MEKFNSVQHQYDALHGPEDSERSPGATSCDNDADTGFVTYRPRSRLMASSSQRCIMVVNVVLFFVSVLCLALSIATWKMDGCTEGDAMRKTIAYSQ